MLLFRFLTRQPWIYAVFGFMLLALICYSIFDAKRGGNIAPFDQLQMHTGVIEHRTSVNKVLYKDDDGGIATIYHEEFTLLFPDSETRTWRVLVDRPLPENSKISLHEDSKYTILNLVVDGQVWIAYQDKAKNAAQRAQNAKDTLTRPGVLGFAGIFIFGGLFAQIRRNSKLARLRQQAQMPLS